jgi:hypothetical protein
MSKKREYRVLLGVRVVKEVRVMAHSAKAAREGVLYGNIPPEDELGGLWGSEGIGEQYVVDVVRVDEDWHMDR